MTRRAKPLDLKRTAVVRVVRLDPLRERAASRALRWLREPARGDGLLNEPVGASLQWSASLCASRRGAATPAAASPLGSTSVVSKLARLAGRPEPVAALGAKIEVLAWLTQPATGA